MHRKLRSKLSSVKSKISNCHNWAHFDENATSKNTIYKSVQLQSLGFFIIDARDNLSWYEQLNKRSS